MEFHDIFYMTPINRDTVIATGFGINKFIHSTDQGLSWAVDSLLLDSVYNADIAVGLSLTSNGYFVAAFSHSPSRGATSILVRGGNKPKAIVNTYERRTSYLFPNPASNILRITSVDALSQIQLVDIFGRDVLHGMTDIQGNGILDVSSLPRGMYDVLLKRGDKMLVVDKVSLTSN